MWWLAHGESEIPSASDWLSSHELAHLDSIRFTKRRNEYLTRRWTAKQAIATVLDLDHITLSRVEVRHHESGAPYAQIDGKRAAIDVSMSDRAGWAVCLVGPPGSAASGTLGIDLEVVEPRSEAFVTDFFTPTEQQYVQALADAEHRHEAANLIWSAKEAALKVQQIGLRVDTRTVEVELQATARPDGWRAMTVKGSDGSMPGWWRRDGVFLLTIAFSSPAEPPQALAGGADLADAVPLHSWVEHPRC